MLVKPRCVKGKYGHRFDPSIRRLEEGISVHVDASYIAFEAVLTQVGEGELDHHIAFESMKLSKAEKNYSRKERDGLAML